MTCSICGKECDEYDMVNGICLNCMSAMMQENDDMEFFGIM